MKGKLLHLLCLLCLLGGMSTRVSAQYVAKKVTDVSEITADANVKYAFQLIEAYTGSSYLNGFIQNNGTYIRMQGTSNSNLLSQSILEGTITDEVLGKYAKQFFTLESTTGGYKIENNSQYWYINSSNRLVPGTKENAGVVTFTFNESKGYFDIKYNNNLVDQSSPYSTYLDAPVSNSKYKGQSHFAIWKIEEVSSATYHICDVTGKELSSVSVEPGSKKVGEAYSFPTYLDVTYHSDNTLWTDVNADYEYVEAKDYYIKTSYKEGFPFTPSDSWTTLYNGKTFAQTGNSGDVAKYAVKIGGNWLNGFTLQRYDGNFLSTSNTWGIEENAAKLFANDAYNLSTADGNNNLYLANDGTMFLDDTKDAFSKKDLLYAYPTQKYVGSYYQGQIGSVTFDQMLAGEGKVALSADKYYYLELHNGTTDENKQLTSAGATVQVLPSAATYAFTAAASTTDNFPGLWKIADGKLTNLNAAFDLGTGITMTHQGVDGNNHGLYNIKMKATDNTDRWLYYDSGTGKVVFGYSSNYNWALREFDESTIFTINLNEVDGTYYATLCAPIPLQATSEDFKVYTGELADGNTVLALEEHDGVIPAGMPVMLISTESATATFQYATTLATYTPNEAWKGTLIDLKFADEATAKNYRTLGKGGAANTAGFYTPGVTTKIPANRAYIEMPSASETQAMLPIRFDDGTLTWIDASILTGEQTDNAAIYDLSGRRIMQPQRGQLYIRGGKKFIAQ